MRLNRLIALSTGLSRRAADRVISDGRVRINGTVAVLGQNVTPQDKVTLDKRPITTAVKSHSIMLNKPAGYVCSRTGQSNKTIYDLLPRELHGLKPVGRLDKDSSGLLLLTNDGKLAHRLTHPSFQKEKIYEVRLSRALTPDNLDTLRAGIILGDGLSKLDVREMRHEARGKRSPDYYLLTHDSTYEVRMSEGRNRQIRRTFATLGYAVTRLHRTKFGPYTLGELHEGRYKRL